MSEVYEEFGRLMFSIAYKMLGSASAALDQFQTVIHLVGRLSRTDIARIDALTRDRLMAMLRAARRR